MQEQGPITIQYPTYSAEPAPSDSHMFGPSKATLRIRRFAGYEEVKEEVHGRLNTQPKGIFMASGTSESLKNFSENQGQYAEMQLNCQRSDQIN
jgi:Neuraminidase (sialidase)